jgi:UPF0271 protein
VSAPLGDAGLRLLRPPGTDARALVDFLRAWPGIADVVVTEEHVLLIVDPLEPPEDPSALLPACTRPPGTLRRHDVRVRYDGADLEEVARRAGLGVDEVVALHTGREVEVKMLGFLPGFAYLGDVEPRLRLPRRASPLLRVPAGAVALAGPYTAIYPFASPGGWNLIGTAVDFQPFSAETGAVLRAGDTVRFTAA